MIIASIVTYNTDPIELSRVLECACNSSIDIIYIVDNSLKDDLRIFSIFHEKIRYIHGHGNIGYGSGHNLAFRESFKYKAFLHVVINPDIYFSSEIVSRIRNFMMSDVSIGLLMPKIIYPNGELQYLCRLLPSPLDLFGRRFLSGFRYQNIQNDRYEMRASEYNSIMNVPFLSGCLMFLNVNALQRVGGFDDSFFMYCEDIDLSRRISASGFKTLFYPNEIAIHAHKKESFKSFKMLMVHVRSAIVYFNKWGWFIDKYRSYINDLTIKQYDK